MPDGIGALIDGRVGWDGAPQSFDDLAQRPEHGEQDLGVSARAAGRAARYDRAQDRRTSVPTPCGAGGGADYHDQQGYHWIDDHIADPDVALPGATTRAVAASV